MKQGSGYTRVHPCNLRPVDENAMQYSPVESFKSQQSDVCSDSHVLQQADVREHAVKVVSVDDVDAAECLAGSETVSGSVDTEVYAEPNLHQVVS